MQIKLREPILSEALQALVVEIYRLIIILGCHLITVHNILLAEKFQMQKIQPQLKAKIMSAV